MAKQTEIKVSENFEAVTFKLDYLDARRWDILEKALFRLTERVSPGLIYYVEEVEGDKLRIVVEKEKN